MSRDGSLAGRLLFAFGVPFGACVCDGQRRGWVIAQRNRNDARRANATRAQRAGGAKGGSKARGVPRKPYDRAPDWWREEMEL